MNGEFSFKCFELSRSGRQMPDQSEKERAQHLAPCQWQLATYSPLTK